MFETIANKFVATIVGLVVFFAWAWADNLLFGPDVERLDRVPEVFYEGGGDVVALRFDLNRTSMLSAHVEKPGSDDYTYVQEVFEAGGYDLTFEVPPGSYVYVQLEVPHADATVGSSLDWTVWVNERRVAKQARVLKQHLDDGYGFFVQYEYGGW